MGNNNVSGQSNKLRRKMKKKKMQCSVTSLTGCKRISVRQVREYLSVIFSLSQLLNKSENIVLNKFFHLVSSIKEYNFTLYFPLCHVTTGVTVYTCKSVMPDNSIEIKHIHIQ